VNFASSLNANSEQHDTSLSEYNANEAITRRIDALTNDSIKILNALRSDGTKAVDSIDLLKNIWDEVYPIASIAGNQFRCQKEILEIQALFTELYALGPREVKRASGFGVSRGASSVFMLKIHRLKSLIQMCAQRFGFGMSTRAAGHYDNDDGSSVRRALE